MSLYDFDTNYIGPKLMPPALRKLRHTSWVKVLLKPIQSLRDLIFNDYADGSNYPLYEHPVTYQKGARVIYLDRKVYQALQTTVGHYVDDPKYWVVVNINFMGARERLKYNSQKIVLEYALNKWFFLKLPPFIYIGNNPTAGRAFLLGETGPSSSSMANDSMIQSYYLGQGYTPIQFDFTIYVPTLLFVTLGSTTKDRENTVRAFADQYVLAGINYNVIPY